MASLFKPSYTQVDPTTGRKVRRRAKKWYGQYSDHDGTHRVPLSTDKTAAQQMLTALVRKAELGRAGVVDHFAEHRKTPLAEHLADFRCYLESKGDTAKQVALKIGRARRVLAGCRFAFIADLSASHVQEFLVRLKADGNGVQTVNYYLREIKSFCRWLVADRRTADNPLSHLAGGNAKTDRRHDRMPLTAGELRSVIVSAAASGEVFRGLTGQDRAVLYATAAGTGFRAAELASLAPEAFDLDSNPPTATLAATDAKNGRAGRATLVPGPGSHATWLPCRQARRRARLARHVAGKGRRHVSHRPGRRPRELCRGRNGRHAVPRLPFLAAHVHQHAGQERGDLERGHAAR